MDGKKTEVDEGEYFPVWLRGFVTAATDPVPNIAGWTANGITIEQLTMPNGVKTDACARAKSRIGMGDAATDAFSSLCFDDARLLQFFGSPSYSMDFGDYRAFGQKKIPRRLVDHPESGTELVGEVVRLEDLAKIKNRASLFIPLRSNEDRFRTVQVTSQQMEKLTAANTPIDWPPVHSGNPMGHLAIYISVDREGNVREAWPLNSDNAGLEDPVREQVKRWKTKIARDEDGKPLQFEGALGLVFKTNIAANP